ncbi:tetraspanin-8-like isoform X1 [Varroa destructor]|uniref:Tetraspanin n=2 Tax=Varroa destructor TaxID=109461 RepID=A0A7M7JSX2_VARDE|nr:tetraspanin-8-like isoform X1 [Varroa destructor]
MRSAVNKENTENHHPRSALTMSPALARSNGVLEISHMVLTAVLWSVGLAAVIMGSLLLTDSRMSGLQTLRHFGPLQSASILVVVIGVLVIVLGIIGCLGVNARSRPLLLIFSFFLVCHMILEIACCILTWYYKRGTTLEKRLQSLIDRVIQQYGDGRIEYISGDEDWSFNRNELSFVEYTLQCCGSTRGVDDYISRKISIPQSCYNRNYINYDYDESYNQGMYNDVSCVKTLQDFLYRHGLALGLLCVLALVLEIGLLVLSMVLADRAMSNTSPKMKESSPQQKPTGYASVTQTYQPSQPDHREHVPVEQTQSEYLQSSDPYQKSIFSEDV